MTAKFILEQRTISTRVQLEITEERYGELAHAREVLSDALAFEQRYELLLGNFISMELALTEICLRQTVELRFAYPDMAETLRQANRHVVNVLTAMRGYADQVPQDFKCLKYPFQFRSIAKSELKKVFERSADYRFMWGLRNHVQHKATAIQGFESADFGADDPHGWAGRMKFYADGAQLREDGDFNPRILDEQPERIDVRKCARLSVKEVGVAHLALRKTVQEHVSRARASFELAIEDYKATGAHSVVGLCARRVGDTTVDIPIFLEWDDVRLQLVNKNHSPPRLGPRRRHEDPTAEQIAAAREAALQSPAQAAREIFVSEQRWQEYEAGLPMPPGLFLLYQFLVGGHPTHRLAPLHA